jgi:hypothetical protein
MPSLSKGNLEIEFQSILYGALVGEGLRKRFFHVFALMAFEPCAIPWKEKVLTYHVYPQLLYSGYTVYPDIQCL